MRLSEYVLRFHPNISFLITLGTWGGAGLYLDYVVSQFFPWYVGTSGLAGFFLFGVLVAWD